MRRPDAGQLLALGRERTRAWKRGALREYGACLRRAAELGDAEATTALACHYRDGLRDRRGREVLRRHRGRCMDLLRRAVALGDTYAMTCLADELTHPSWLATLSPVGRRRSHAEGLRWYRAAAARGDSAAAFNLAMTYLNAGRHRLAVKWFRRVAGPACQPEALLELARAELFGLGIRRNVPAALRKLRGAAGERRGRLSPFDIETSMVLLGTLYREGWLVRRDYGAACQWLRRAGRLGSEAARGLLRDLGEPDRRTSRGKHPKTA